MDITFCSIILGIALCVAYSITRGICQRTFDVSMLALVFLSSFGLLSGVALIQVGLSGKKDDLPVYWRQYVAVAGVVAIGFAFQFLMTTFRNALIKSAKEENGTVAKES